MPIFIIHMSSYLECSTIDSLFDMVRGIQDVDMDWVKLQVYGLKTVPETFPRDIPSFHSIVKRINPELYIPEEGECEIQDMSDQW